jgi:hypothetical protein
MNQNYDINIDKEYSLPIGSSAELIIKTSGKSIIFTIIRHDSIFSKTMNLKDFNFCDNVKEVVDLTFFTLKNRNFTIKTTQKELLLDIEYNIGFKKKNVNIVLKNTKEVYEEDLKSEINSIKRDLNFKHKEFSDLYDKELRSLNKYCEEMFKFFGDNLENITKKLELLGGSRKPQDSDAERFMSINLDDISSIKYNTPRQVIYMHSSPKQTDKIVNLIINK